MTEKQADPQDEPQSEREEEYDLMLTLEELESLQEELNEAGFSNLAEIETALAIPAKSNDQAGREQLVELRDLMQELGVANLPVIQARILALHAQLDELDGFGPE